MSWVPARYFSGTSTEATNFPSYEVNPQGDIRNKANPSKLMSKYNNKDGYMLTSLRTEESKHRTILVHRLILSSFRDRPSKEHTADHLNQDKTDNRLANLRWATRNEQALNKPDNIKKISTFLPIRQLNDKHESIATYDSVSSFPEHERKGISEAINQGSIYKKSYWEVLPISDIPGEVWTSGKDCNKEFSNLGRIRRLHRTSVYYEVKAANGIVFFQSKKHQLRRVIAHLFLGLDLNDDVLVVKHINGDTSDVRVNNLEIVTKTQSKSTSQLKIFKVTNLMTNQTLTCTGLVELRTTTGSTRRGFPEIKKQVKNKFNVEFVEQLKTKRQRETIEDNFH